MKIKSIIETKGPSGHKIESIEGIWIPNTLFNIKGIVSPTLAIYNRIRSLDTNDPRGSWIKNIELAYELDVTEKTIERGLKDLLNEGVLIKTDGHFEKNGKFYNRRYLKTICHMTNEEKLSVPTNLSGTSDKNKKCKSVPTNLSGQFRQTSRHYTRSNSKENNVVVSKETSNSDVSDETSSRVGNSLLNKNKLNDLAQRIKADSKKEIKETSCPKSIQAYLDLWTKLTGKTNRKNSNTLAQTIQDLKKLRTGKLYNNISCPETKFLVGKKINIADFETALMRFVDARNNPDYYPQNKEYIKKINLRQFLFNEYGKNEKSRSYFAHFLVESPLKLPSQNLDKFPKLTEQIINTYRFQVLGGLSYTPSLFDQTKFIDSASRLNDFFVTNKARLNGLAKAPDQKKAELLFKAVLNDLGQNKIKHISPGYFCSDKTFSDRLPRWMYAEALLAEPNQMPDGSRSKNTPSPLDPNFHTWYAEQKKQKEKQNQA